MLSRMFLSAMFKSRNILFLIGWFILVKIFEIGNLSIAGVFFNGISVYLYLAGVIAYIGLTMKTMYNDKFNKEFINGEKIRKMRILNIKCQKIFKENRRFIAPVYQKNIRRILFNKNEIIANYEKTKDEFVRDNILEKVLNLVYSYIKLTKDFCIRRREIDNVDIGSVKERISTNTRRMNFEVNEGTKENLKKIIEMDHRLLERIKEEKINVDSIRSKLEYIESTINMLKHHTLTSVDHIEITDQLDQVINEASALESVLDSRRRNKSKI